MINVASLSIEETASLILNALDLEDHSYYGTETTEKAINHFCLFLKKHWSVTTKFLRCHTPVFIYLHLSLLMFHMFECLVQNIQYMRIIKTIQNRFSLAMRLDDMIFS